MTTLALAVLATLATAAAAQEPAPGWPRTITVQQGTLTVYTPQLEKFEGISLSGRSAISWQAAAGGEPIFGVFWFDATVLSDKEAGRVHVQKIAVRKVKFPGSTAEQEKKVAAVVEREVPEWDLSPSIDELQAAVAATQRVKKSEKGIAAPVPKLLFSTDPAVLLPYDGQPVVRPAGDSGLERVANTPLFVVKDPATGRFYLGSESLWYEAADPKGPWTHVAAPSPKVKAYFDANKPAAQPGAAQPGAAQPGAAQPGAAQPGAAQPGATQQGAPQSAAPPPAPQQPAPPPAPAQPGAERKSAEAPAKEAPATPPRIIVSTQPTELIVFDGKPSYAPLTSDGNLLYADNADGTVLVHVPSSETYVLVSGRWYKAKSLEGPWAAVRPDKVPPAFKGIPPESAVAEARTFVAGTDEADDALADSQIPQTAAVKREQSLQVTYDGEPKFKPIEGTAMSYAINTSFSVIQEGGRYYACHQGVWYVATSPKGPFTVSDKRPPSIEQVPTSVPVYNTKYVYVYQTTPQVVYVGYTPGYVGVYPYYGTVVYGTGYYYPPYIGPVYCYPYPATFGVHVAWSPWTGFGVGVSFGTPFFSVGITFGGYRGFYGPRYPYYPPRPPYGYRPPPPGYRPPAGGYRPGYRPTPVGGPRATQPIAGRGGGSVYQQPGNVGRNAQVQPADRRAPSVSQQPNNVYAGRDGNVYRQNQGGGWDRNTSGGWQQAGSQPSRGEGGGAASARAQPASSGGAPAGLGPDAAARSRGGYGGGGGGARGGGGGGFRGGGGRR
jgi:hypothetical protein